jgi:hypothetical protein
MQHQSPPSLSLCLLCKTELFTHSFDTVRRKGAFLSGSDGPGLANCLSEADELSPHGWVYKAVLFRNHVSRIDQIARVRCPMSLGYPF